MREKFCILAQVFHSTRVWTTEVEIFENSSWGINEALSFVQSKMKIDFSADQIEHYKKHWEQFGSISEIGSGSAAEFLIVLKEIVSQRMEGVNK